MGPVSVFQSGYAGVENQSDPGGFQSSFRFKLSVGRNRRRQRIVRWGDAISVRLPWKSCSTNRGGRMATEVETTPAWLAFIQARARCIHRFTEQGMTDEQIAYELSLPASKVADIRTNRAPDGKWRG
jgi:hypothetical protein